MKRIIVICNFKNLTVLLIAKKESTNTIKLNVGNTEIENQPNAKLLGMRFEETIKAKPYSQQKKR